MSSKPKSEKAGPEAHLAASYAAELEALKAEASSLRRELANRESDLRAFQQRIASIEAEAARRMQQQVEAAEQRVLTIYRSSSWRLTGPFRRTTRLIKRLFGRGPA